MRSGAAGSLYPPKLLGQDYDDGSHKRVLLRGVQRFLGVEPGGTAVPDHFKYGCGRSGAPMGLSGGWGRGGSRWVEEGGASSRRIILCGQLTGRVHRP